MSDNGLEDFISSRSKSSFSSSPCAQTGSETLLVGSDDPFPGHFPGGKVRPRHDSDQSPPTQRRGPERVPSVPAPPAAFVASAGDSFTLQE